MLTKVIISELLLLCLKGKIAATKAVRERTGLGLRESKELIDAVAMHLDFTDESWISFRVFGAVLALVEQKYQGIWEREVLVDMITMANAQLKAKPVTFGDQMNDFLTNRGVL